MKCFYHEGIDAVAVCKNCSKALCRGCAVDVGNGMACRNACEPQVRAVNAMLRKGQNAIRRSSWSYYGLAAFLLLTGLVIGQDSLRSEMRGWALFGDGMSLVMVLGAVFFFIMAKKAGADNR